MAAFFEQRLDTKITRGALGGPRAFGRTKLYGSGGQLIQNFTNAMPVHVYDVSHGVRSARDFDLLLSMFYVVMFTPYIGFRFKDWRDFLGTATNTALELVTGTTYQLQRKYTVASSTFLRDIKKPVSGTVVIYNAGGTPLTATIDYTTGIADVTGTPSYWTGEFDVPVTFTDDEWLAELEVSTQNLHVVSRAVKLEELKRL